MQIRLKSSSGGIFTSIANYILENDGIVIGAAFDENNKLRHIAISNQDGLEKLRGSKYLQSDLNEIFSFIKENIKLNKILFVGTPCQVAGLYGYLGKNKNYPLSDDEFLQNHWMIYFGYQTRKIQGNQI